MEKVTTLRTGEYVTYWIKSPAEIREGILAVAGTFGYINKHGSSAEEAVVACYEAIEFLNTKCPKPGYKWGEHYYSGFGFYLEERVKEEEEEGGERERE